MNTTFPDDTTPPAGDGSPCGHGECVCAGAGPAMSRIGADLLRQFGPSPEVRKHLDRARLELLQGLRTLLDERISQMQKETGTAARGDRVPVD
ncbi:MAG: hypothetical protein R2762_27200 [Bryobacteraceae bacterium]